MQNYSIEWSPQALIQLDICVDFYIVHSGIKVANAFSNNILDCLKIIAINPYIARKSFHIPDLREYIVKKYPFIISFYINENIIVITSLLHQSQDRYL